ncbi:hypothetical protein ICN84_10880 [Akkermansia glycaniphila]|uniref:hypothetical protein n=1 Tax=Akkermansia glycaniphila TaxID=1679444 RepID=UPI001C00FD28|nr:hypothetical protein [Akkermansia glycaniphila]MBT9450571.1 hypothetical protein [Akkermansia glycaniphila]
MSIDFILNKISASTIYLMHQRNIVSIPAIISIGMFMAGCEKNTEPTPEFSLHSLEKGAIVFNSTYPSPRNEWVLFHLRVHGSGIDELLKPLDGPEELRDGQFIFNLTIENQGLQDVHYYFPANHTPYLVGTFDGSLEKPIFSEKYTQPQLLKKGDSQTITFEGNWRFLQRGPLSTKRGTNGALVFIVNVEGTSYPVIAPVNINSPSLSTFLKSGNTIHEPQQKR